MADVDDASKPYMTKRHRDRLQKYHDLLTDFGYEKIGSKYAAAPNYRHKETGRYVNTGFIPRIGFSWTSHPTHSVDFNQWNGSFGGPSIQLVAPECRTQGSESGYSVRELARFLGRIHK